MKIKLNGTILESNNELVVEQWKKAGYAEIDKEEKVPRKGKTQKGDNEPLNDGE